MLLLCLLLAACGVGPQNGPVPIDVPVPTKAQPEEPALRGPRTVTVYFILGDRLTPVRRGASETSLEQLLLLLAAGPSPREAQDGLRTAVAPGVLSPGPAATTPGTVVVEVTRDFTEVSGRNQLLAVAQVVWTVTEGQDITNVRMTSAGMPLEVPTDTGLSAGPVTRSDYLSVKPAPAPS